MPSEEDDLIAYSPPVTPVSIKQKINNFDYIKSKCFYGSKFHEVKKQMIKWYTLFATHTMKKKVISLFYEELIQINKNKYE